MKQSRYFNYLGMVLIMNNFDAKNQRDFELNTDRLVQAIDKIRMNNSLPPTIAQLASLTGMHRNAISKRVWPSVRLEEIKTERKRTSNTSNHQNKPQDPVKVLEEKLENAKRELVYWFNKNLDNEKQIKQLEQNLCRMTDARSNYENMLKQERIKTSELTTQIKTLKEMLSS